MADIPEDEIFVVKIIERWQLFGIHIFGEIEKIGDELRHVTLLKPGFSPAYMCFGYRPILGSF